MPVKKGAMLAWQQELLAHEPHVVVKAVPHASKKFGEAAVSADARPLADAAHGRTQEHVVV